GLAGKVSFVHRGRDGYYTNQVRPDESIDTQNVNIARGYLAYDGIGFDATAIVEYFQARNGSTAIVNTSSPGVHSFYRPGQFTTVDDFDFVTASEVPSQSDIDRVSATLRMEIETGIGDLVSV